MKKTDLLIGFIIGSVTSIIGTFIYLFSFTDFSAMSDFKIINENGVLGKVMTLGAVLNIGVFFVLLQKKKDLMARGIILSIIMLAILTIFI